MTSNIYRSLALCLFIAFICLYKGNLLAAIQENITDYQGNSIINGSAEIVETVSSMDIARNESIIIENTSSYMERSRWHWTIFVVANNEVLNDIRCVEYTLHPTFPEPVQRVCNKGVDTGKGFFFSTNGWGTFSVGVKIIFNDGHEEYLQHQLSFN